MFYRPKGKAVLADVVPYFEDGEFKLFYLKDYRDKEKEGEGCPWYLLTTKDLVNYVDHGPVILRGKQHEQDLYIFTGCCVKFKGEYFIFYTGHNPHFTGPDLVKQKVLLAKSKDLIHWEKQKDFAFRAPDFLEKHDFRDPFIFYDRKKKTYCMLLAARLKSGNPDFSGGITLIAYSDDLYNWEISEKPFYAPNAYYTHECPDLFKMGNWWYLVFSEYTDKIVTRYRMSKSMDGPWITPKADTFDAHAFYAAKSASDGKRRIMFGWNCIKLDEKDSGPWQWGGTLIPHELVQAKDGTLYVKCPEEIKAAYSKPVEIIEGFTLGPVEKLKKKGIYHFNKDDGMSVVMLGEMPQTCKIEMEFTLLDDVGDFGVLLRESNNLKYFYKAKIEPKFNRLAFDKIPRFDRNIHLHVDCERYCPLNIGNKNKLLIIAQDSVLEVYINDKVAMGARMFDLKSGNFGIYAHNTTMTFENVRLFKP